MALKIESRMYVPTPNGEREIQLCIGDITALSPAEKVDVICISCFPGDYTPTSTSLIGALLKRHGINVATLARKKKEDLRQQFHCWFADLPEDENIPYRTLLCFERSAKQILESGGHTLITKYEAVREIFRAMMPIFNNKNKSIITPLLATGDQSGNKSEMMKCMVKSAIGWMKIGLPLQLLKIVIYARRNTRGEFQMRQNDKDCIEEFGQLVEVYSKQRAKLKNVSITVDCFLVYSEADKSLANTLLKGFKNVNKNVEIRSVKDVKSKAETWHHDFFSIMQVSHRVVPIITGNFLEDKSCLDLYNVALCVNRYSHRPILAPVCLERGLLVPVYMGLVQWINVRPPSDEMIMKASADIMEDIESYQGEKNQVYDVFISYSHKNLTQAKVFRDSFQKINPELHIFFDYDSLKTGYSWQQTLFKAIDNSRCLVALISPDYIKSVVCNEEFNLALAKHVAKDKDLELLPVIIEDVSDTIPNKVADIRPLMRESLTSQLIDALPLKVDKDSNLETLIESLCTKLNDFLNSEEGQQQDLFSEIDMPIKYTEQASLLRKHIFSTYYELWDGRIVLQEDTEKLKQENASETSQDKDTHCDVFISYSMRDQKFAVLLAKLMRLFNKDIRIVDKSVDLNEAMTNIASAKCIVVLLSPHYVKSVKEVEEFNVILSRQRSAKDQQLMYSLVLDSLPTKPTYFHLIHSYTSINDDFWLDVAADNAEKFDLRKEIILARDEVAKAFDPFSSAAVLAIVKATYDIESVVYSKRSIPMKPSCGIVGNIAHLQLLVENAGRNEKPNEMPTGRKDYKSTPTVTHNDNSKPTSTEIDNHTSADNTNSPNTGSTQLVTQHGAYNQETKTSSPPADRMKLDNSVKSERVPGDKETDQKIQEGKDVNHSRSCSVL